MESQKLNRLCHLVRIYYSKCAGNVAEIHRKIQEKGEVVSNTTIRKLLIKNGYTSNHHGGKRIAIEKGKYGAYSNEEIQEILPLYKKFEGNSRKASQYLRLKHGSTGRKYAGSSLEKVWGRYMPKYPAKKSNLEKELFKSA